MSQKNKVGNVETVGNLLKTLTEKQKGMTIRSPEHESVKETIKMLQEIDKKIVIPRKVFVSALKTTQAGIKQFDDWYDTVISTTVKSPKAKKAAAVAAPKAKKAAAVAAPKAKKAAAVAAPAPQAKVVVKAPKTPRQKTDVQKEITEKKGRLMQTLKAAINNFAIAGVTNIPEVKKLLQAAPDLTLPRYFQKMLNRKRGIDVEEADQFDTWVKIMTRVVEDPKAEYKHLLPILPLYLRQWLPHSEIVIPPNVLGCAVLHFDPERKGFGNITKGEKQECKKYIVKKWAETDYVTDTVDTEVEDTIESFEFGPGKKPPSMKNIEVVHNERTELSVFDVLADATIQEKIKCAVWIKKNASKFAGGSDGVKPSRKKPRIKTKKAMENPTCENERVELACGSTIKTGKQYVTLNGKRIYLKMEGTHSLRSTSKKLASPVRPKKIDQ